MAMEIERKFLSRGGPTSRASRVEIEQGYLALGDGQGDAEVRLRRKNDELYLTVKAGSGRTRVEEELELDREPFESLWPLTEGRRVAKTRHVLLYGKVDIELDLYSGDLDGLEIAEVEFPDEETADEFAARLARRGGDGRRAVLEPDAGDEGFHDDRVSGQQSAAIVRALASFVSGRRGKWSSSASGSSFSRP